MSSILDIKKLKFKWPGQKANILEIDEFQVKKGELVFLQGPSGSGKSTLLNLIGGVLSPDEGSVSVLDTPMTKLSLGKRDQFRGDHMGFIFQMFNLLPYFSPLENVILPCQFSSLKTERVLAQVDSLEAEAKRLLLRLRLSSELIEKKSVTQLSIGQQQRVATARALMGRPEIIIADEPTSALDFDVRESFLKLLFEECHKFGITLIFVSHDRNLGDHFDKVISLESINKASIPLGELQ